MSQTRRLPFEARIGEAGSQRPLRTNPADRREGRFLLPYSGIGICRFSALALPYLPPLRRVQASQGRRKWPLTHPPKERMGKTTGRAVGLHLFRRLHVAQSGEVRPGNARTEASETSSTKAMTSTACILVVSFLPRACYPSNQARQVTVAPSSTPSPDEMRVPGWLPGCDRTDNRLPASATLSRKQLQEAPGCPVRAVPRSERLLTLPKSPAPTGPSEEARYR